MYSKFIKITRNLKLLHNFYHLWFIYLRFLDFDLFCNLNMLKTFSFVIFQLLKLWNTNPFAIVLRIILEYYIKASTSNFQFPNYECKINKHKDN